VGSKGHGRTLKPDLVIKDEYIDLSPEAKCCSICGKAYIPNGTENSEIVEVEVKAYKAANWCNVGHTKGRGKLGPSRKISVPIKEVFLYPLKKKF